MTKNVVELFRQLHTRKGRAHFGRFSAEGMRLVERALRADIVIDAMLVGDSAQQDERIQAALQLARAQAIAIHVIDDATARDLSAGRKLGDLFAIVQAPEAKSLASIVDAVPHALLLALVDIVEPGNVGAMIRTAHGLGASAVLMAGCSDAFAPKAVRTSMGSVFKLPVVTFNDPAALVAAMDAHQVTSYATVSSEGLPLPTVAFPRRARAVVMGGEFYGLSAEIAQACTHQITIPMAAGIDSFSVSAAAAIALYAARMGRGD